MRIAGVLASLVALSMVATAFSLQDDAGSGGDAPAAPSDAYHLAADSSYSGTLFPAGDADWYFVREPVHIAGCVLAMVGGPAEASVTLALDAGLARNATLPLGPAQGIVLALATSSVDQAWLGLGPRADAQGGNASTGSYQFNLTMRPRDAMGPGDAGTGRDAGPTAPSAITVGDGCIGGSLDAARGDIIDTYTFDGVMGQRVALSLGDDGARHVALVLSRPDGTTAADLTPDTGQNIMLDATGTWALTATLTSGVTSTYTMALAREPKPDPAPCRPMCSLGPLD